MTANELWKNVLFKYDYTYAQAAPGFLPAT